MDEKIKVSIILPSLNVARYIGACLTSVREQSLNEIEMICVDAGSTDGTLEIIREHGQKDERISLIHSDRKSYGYQVNQGIKSARGKYVAVVDTDDFVGQNMYETLFRRAEENRADFVKSDYYGYREEAAGNEREKVCSVLTDRKYYNCIVEPIRNQKIFRNLYPAIWSGIYSRSFLENNGIWCNETPGASYQDTGFWFLAYAYAGRALFLDIPFYRYRLDNAASSVHDTQKVYCICDEWNYIAKNLAGHSRLEEVSDSLSYVFYRKYKRNLERISPGSRDAFLRRFSADFLIWDQYGYLSYRMFSGEEERELLEIMHDPEKYGKGVQMQEEKFLAELERQPEVILYGAGKVGREILSRMKTKANVVGVAVSGNVVKEERLMGVPVRTVDALLNYRKTAYVVLAVMTEAYKIQMREKLRELEFAHIIEIPYGLFHY